MAHVYELEIQSYLNGEEVERYGIGIFLSKREAQKTAKRYLKEVKGFRDYYCEYSIKETELVGDGFTGMVHTYFGWNLDEDGNAYDIVSGLMYDLAEAAEVAMESVRDTYDRQEWALRHWRLGKCEWAEGFEREYPDGTPVPTLAQLREELLSRTEPRTICGIEYEYSDQPQYGFPITVGEDLFLMAVDDDFLLNGFTVRRLRDIHEIDNRRGIYQTIAEKEGLTKFQAPDVDMTDWHSVFISLQWLDKPVIVEREYEPDFFRLGRIEEVRRDRVLMRYFDADGVWQEPVEISFRAITSVTFGGRYSETFSKYV